MTALLVIVALAAVAVVVLWVIQSVIRMAAAALAVAALHSAPPLWLVATLAVALATLAVAIACRTLGRGLLIKSEIQPEVTS